MQSARGVQPECVQIMEDSRRPLENTSPETYMCYHNATKIRRTFTLSFDCTSTIIYHVNTIIHVYVCTLPSLQRNKALASISVVVNLVTVAVSKYGRGSHPTKEEVLSACTYKTVKM